MDEKPLLSQETLAKLDRVLNSRIGQIREKFSETEKKELEGYIQDVRRKREDVKKALYSTKNQEMIQKHINLMRDIREITKDITAKYNELNWSNNRGATSKATRILRRAEELDIVVEQKNELQPKIEQYNKMKGSMRRNIDILDLYHKTNILREDILNLNNNRLQYKIGVYGTDGQIYVITGTFEDLKKGELITVTSPKSPKKSVSRQRISFGSGKKYSPEELQKYNDVQKIKMTSDGSNIKQIFDLTEGKEDESVKRLETEIKQFSKNTPLSRQIAYLFAWVNAKRKVKYLNLGHVLEAYFDAVAMGEEGRPKGSTIVKLIEQSTNNADWLLGGDVTLDGIDYQVKLAGGNTYGYKQITRFAEEIYLMSDFFDKLDVTQIKVHQEEFLELIKGLTINKDTMKKGKTEVQKEIQRIFSETQIDIKF